MKKLTAGACIWLLAGCAQGPGTVPIERPVAPVKPAPSERQAPSQIPIPIARPPAASAPASSAPGLNSIWSLASLPLGGFPGVSSWVNEAEDLAANHLTDTPWVVPGHWAITRGQPLGIKGHILEQSEVRPDPVASFVRPAGMTGGKLPVHYRASVLALAEPAPRGREAALLAWFQDVRHYVEVVAKPDGLEVWQADGAVPDHSDGWTRLWRKDLPTASGQVRRLGLDVDTRSGILGVYLDGRVVGEALAPLIPSSEAEHTLALRSIGGVVYYGDLEVKTLE